MKRILFTSLACITLAFAGGAQSNVVEKAAQLELKGQFKEAAAVLKEAIGSGKPTPPELKTLEFDLDRLERIKQDFSWTREDLFREMKAVMKGLTREEFDGWVKQGWFESREIDGKTLYFDSENANLFFRHPELYARQIPPQDEGEHERVRLNAVTSIKKAALAEKTPYVLPQTVDVTMKVSADRDVAAPGEVIRAWIPIPRRYAFQTDFKIISSSSKPLAIDSEDSPIRAAYFEQPAVAGKSTNFKIQYEYLIHGVYFNLQPDKIQPYNEKDPELKRFTLEAPHVIFTPELKALSAKIVGSETNPMLKAKKIFDWQADHLSYSYALEYSTIRNISEYCRLHNYGDCGEQALLFITLCRYNNVPARWQSGWDLFPKHISQHDWAEIYLAPYGWVPVDAYAGNYAMRYITTLTPAQKIEIRDFYFGGLDEFRMAANSDHSVNLNPPKTSIRSDDVDFQRGELEHSGKNIYLNQFSYTFNYKFLPAPNLP